MRDKVEIIGNIRFWPKGFTTLHYYNAYFTGDKIIWEFLYKNWFAMTYSQGAILLLPILPIAYIIGKKKAKIRSEIEIYDYQKGYKDLDNIIGKNPKNFIIDYNQIDNILIKKGKIIIEFIREVYNLEKKTKFYFDKQDQHIVESVFKNIFPVKSKIHGEMI